MSALMANYNRLDLAFTHGEGAYLFGSDGRRYLDFAAGIAVDALGHAHPRLVAALNEQAGKLWHCSNLYRIPLQESLAERLVATTFADAALFCNSGAEAVECGLKIVRKYHDTFGDPRRYRVICFDKAFHGRTFATIAAGGQDKLLAGFDPPLDGFDHVPFDDLDAVAGAVGEETAAILVEPVQGEGGIRVASDTFLRGLRHIADDNGLLLVFDEIQCGMGRTGRLFAHQWSGVAPDIMAVAKGLGSGFPVGACLASGNAARTLTPGSHGTTFGGNPLAMAVANAVMDIIDDQNFLATVHNTGETLRERLSAVAARYPNVIVGVRGVGLMVGIQCAVENRTLMLRLLDAGLLSVPGGDNVVRLLPPLIIDERHVGEAVSLVSECCAALSERAA